MELRQLRYFLAVAEELHFGRAAERLRISQPPLSTAIKSLEQELGAQLFLRSTRSVALTPEGEFLQGRLLPLIDDLDSVAIELAEVRQGLRGRLRIGFVSSASYSILPHAVRRVQAALPLVDLRLEPLTSAEQVAQLLAGGLDLGIVRDQPAVPGVRQEPVRTEPLVVVLPEEHPLATGDCIALDQLEHQPMILFPYELMPGYLSRVTELLERGGVPTRVVQRTVHQETVLGLVAAGVGLSVLPEPVARIGMPGIVALPIAEHPTTELTVAWHEQISPAARVFADCVHEAAKRH